MIRNRDVAARAVEKAIALTKHYGTRLYILHASTADEIALIKQAKIDGLPVFAETTPHHLFLNENAYTTLQGRAVVNPPLRAASDTDALWHAVRDGTIDTIGSDHAPHLSHEKAKPYGECPSGMPGIETTLPLLITAYRDGLLSLERIIELTCARARTIFGLAANADVVLVDMNNTKRVCAADLKTKCAWSAFEGRDLIGWPRHVIMDGLHFEIS
jgi:dihydroorotase